MKEQVLTQVAQCMVGDYLYEVEHYSRIQRSGYETLCLETTIHLMQQGFITTINHEPDHEVIGLRGTGVDKDFRPAFICYELRPQQELAHVIIGGVSADNHSQGFYRALWDHLVEWVRLNHPEIKAITGCYHVDNVSSARMNEKFGRKPIRVTTEYRL